MKAIVNANIVLYNSIIFDGVILIENDRIIDFGEKSNIKVPSGAVVINAKGNYAAPGFIDLHTHSSGGKWFFEEPEAASAYILKHGVTSVFPALYYNMDQAEFLKGIRDLKAASKQGAGRIIEGIYMEGPYLNPKYGCDAANYKWNEGVLKEKYQPLIDEVGEFAKVWCIAPEVENIENFVDDVRVMDPNAVFSVAHSEATPYQVLDLVPKGLKLATHHTNATGDLPKYPECRGVCVDEAVNYSDDIYAELIVDSKGIHVDPFMLKLVLKIKGKDKVILISDACVFDGPIPPGYDGVTDINFDFDGQIAGSKLTMDVACQNMMKHTGSGICDLFKFAAYNPAKLLNISDIGSIGVGNRANIVIVDDKINVKQVMLNGELVKVL
ncbi:MAG: amidohydrolase family protein [Clostridia bacterium]|jgi:N-acetylglucosamine-6-phosphate deacetylase|nr:amidohydrolase family protein [Clostridia bacterium]MBT7122520.1 amidohydrolase family protein [Clostridia bacterium]